MLAAGAAGGVRSEEEPRPARSLPRAAVLGGSVMGHGGAELSLNARTLALLPLSSSFFHPLFLFPSFPPSFPSLSPFHYPVD